MHDPSKYGFYIVCVYLKVTVDSNVRSLVYLLGVSLWILRLLQLLILTCLGLQARLLN